MKQILVLGLSLFVGFSFSVPAAAAAKKEKQFVDEGEISFVNTTGNSKVTSLAVKNEMRYHFTESVLGTWKLGALYGENGGAKNAENYATELRLANVLSNGISGFVTGGWQQNTFAGIETRIYGGLGAGYALLDGPHNFLVAEIGVNYAADTYTDSTDKYYPEGRAFGEYTYAFTDKTRFSQSVEFLDDLKDTAKYRLNSETAIIATLGGSLSLKTSYLVGYLSEPTPDTLEKTDAMVLVTLVLTL